MKLEDEQAELADVKKQLEAEQAAADESKKKLAAEQAQLRKENDARIAAKQVARAKENAEDARLLAETMQALEKKDKDRQKALKDFQVRQPLCSHHKGRASAASQVTWTTPSADRQLMWTLKGSISCRI